ncbi:MAG: hypothetical protein WC375_03230 [Methanomassiliicoccales archaeon]|jgi:hypothetical protein
MEKKKECKKCGEELVIDETPKLKVGGREVGINDLDDIMSAVMSLEIDDRATIGKELLRRVKENDFVPSGVEREYEKALIEEYFRRTG